MKKITLLLAVFVSISACFAQEVSSYVSGLNGPRKMTVNGTTLYVNGYENVYTIDTSSGTPTANLLYTFPTDYYAYKTEISGNDLFILVEHYIESSDTFLGTEIVKLDITNVGAGTQTVVSSSNFISSFALSGTTIYYSEEIETAPDVFLIDIYSFDATQTSPTPTLDYTGLDTEVIDDMQVYSNTLYISSRDHQKVFTLDLSSGASSLVDFLAVPEINFNKGIFILPSGDFYVCSAHQLKKTNALDSSSVEMVGENTTYMDDEGSGPFNANLRDVVVIGDTAYMALENQGLIVTVNVNNEPSDSDIWVEKSSGISAGKLIPYITIADENTSWALASEYTSDNYLKEFTKSVDGGENWIAGTINLGVADNELGTLSISAVSATTAWVAAYSRNGTTLGGIWKTTDGGLTWNQQTTASYGLSSFPNIVHFFDANNGITTGDPVSGEFEIYITSNSGANWTAVPANNIPDALAGEYGFNTWYDASTNTFWFGTTLGRIFMSPDRGNTWSVYQSNMTGDLNNNWLSFSLSDDNTGTLFTLQNGVLTSKITTDGGITFNDFTASGDFGISEIEYIPNTSILFANLRINDPELKFSYSLDNGSNFSVGDTGILRNNVTFFSQTMGIAGGISSASGGIFKYNPNNTLVLSTHNPENTENTLLVYPNPTTDRLNIKSNLPIHKVEILSLQGQVLKTFTKELKALNVEALQSGLYLVKAYTNAGASSIRFIKQ